MPSFSGTARASMRWGEAAALSGCCAYLLLFSLPLAWDVALVTLALAAVVSGTDGGWDSRGPGTYVTAGVMLLVAATIVSTTGASNVRQSALGSAPMLPATLLFWMVRYRLSASCTRALLLSLVALAALISACIMFVWCIDASHNPHLWIHGISRIVTVPNDTLVLAVLSPVSLAVFFCDRNPTWRAGAMLTLLLCTIAIVLAQSRMAILTMVGAQLVTLAVLRRFNVRWLLAMAVAAFAADAICGFSLLHKFADARSESRIALWWAAGAMFLDAPVLGQGPNSFGALRLAFLASYPETKWFGIEQGYVPWPHNLYLELLAERGAFALAGFGGALVVALNAARVLCRDDSRDVRTAAACSFGVLASIAFAGMAELSMLHLWVPVITLTFLGLVAMLANSRRNLK